MKCKFENSVNVILFLMFSLVLVTIVLSNCKGCLQHSSDKPNVRQIDMDSINIDSVHK